MKPQLAQLQAAQPTVLATHSQRENSLTRVRTSGGHLPFLAALAVRTDPAFPMMSGRSALCAAAVRADVEGMRAALEADEDPRQTSGGFTPAEIVVRARGTLTSTGMRADTNTRRLAALRLLADYGGLDASIATKALCLRQCGPAVTRLLLDAGADARCVGGSGTTPLHHASSADVVRLLLAAGADVHARDSGGRTPLHICTTGWPSEGRRAAMTALIEAGADVNAVDACAATALTLARGDALHSGFAAIVQLLLEAGADPTIATDAGETPMVLAIADLERCLQHCSEGNTSKLADQRRVALLLSRAGAWWRRRHALLAARGWYSGAPAGGSDGGSAGASA